MNKITNRIEWIDLARGLGMLYIVSLHTGGVLSFPGSYVTFMMMFFILSGLLFNETKTIKELIVGRINRLLIPFLCYYLLGCVCYYVLQWVFPNYLDYAQASDSAVRSKGILDIFTQRQYFDGPIWFILCLFWSEIYFIFIVKFLPKYIVPIVVLACGAIGWILGTKEVFVPMMMDVGLTVLPVFYMGWLLRKMNFIGWSLSWKTALICVVCTITSIVLILRFNPGIHLHYNFPHCNVLVLFILSITAPVTLLFLCRYLCTIPLEALFHKDSIPHFPIISYFGRNSLTPLGMHHMILRPLMVLGMVWGWRLFLATMLLSYLCIPVINRLLPMMAGKVDISNLPMFFLNKGKQS